MATFSGKQAMPDRVRPADGLPPAAEQLALPIRAISPEDRLLAHVLEHSGLVGVTTLPDGTLIGLGRLLYTTALYVDLNATGYGRRYCYETARGAVDAYYSLRAGAGEPTGYIAQRGAA